MRKEPYGVGSFVHVYNRGNRKQEIVRDEIDRTRFLQMLYYFNDAYSEPNLFRSLAKLWKSDFYSGFERPAAWPERQPLVRIHAFILKDNHFHLILEEIVEGGITRFMRKLGTGMTNRFNTRYAETGKLFQGSYKAKLIDDENYLRYLFAYLHVKNAFELYPGGLEQALTRFDDAYEFAVRYPYSSLAHYALNRDSSAMQIVGEGEMFRALFPDSQEMKEFARDCLATLVFDEKKCELV